MLSKSLQYIRYYTALLVLYGATALGGVYIAQPSLFRPLPIVTPVQALSPISPPVSKSSNTPANHTISGRPVRIVIDVLDIDLPVDKGGHNPTDGSWTLSDTRAQFALPSQPANDQSGMTLIYGHNSRYVFAPLHRLRPGDRAEVTTANGYVFHYLYQRYDMVTPDTVSIFAYSGKPRLTLQTCSGNWDGMRRLHHFTFIDAKKQT